ncbi:hypothetical protein GCM10009716_10900 [Streptomyces sodiiphilus]|uniref:M23ase beta-sheet core domain-containing protein n=1 Tax=Streptomyces sodiiphilus TaxID=226217 RepID=A0ABN2NTU9_9ACTN
MSKVIRRQDALPGPPCGAPAGGAGPSRRAFGGALLGALAVTGPLAGTAAARAAGHLAPGGEIPVTVPKVAEPWPLAPPPFGAPDGDTDTYPHDGPEEGDEEEPPGAGQWTRPVSGYPVSAPYRLPGNWRAGYHTGVDFAMPAGVPVRAVGPGTVVVAGEAGDYGNVVMSLMRDDHYTLCAHLSEVLVPPGRPVVAGTLIGYSGNTGRSTGPHLHFEVRAEREYGTDIDPAAYLARHGVALY